MSEGRASSILVLESIEDWNAGEGELEAISRDTGY